MAEIPKTDEKTLELMYNEIKEKLKSQNEAVKELENKSSRIIGFVGIITGAGLSWIQFLTKGNTFQFHSALEIVVFSSYLVGIAFFIASMVCAFLGYKVSKFRSDPDPKKLVEKYFYHPYNKLMEQLLDNFAISYAENSKINWRKAKFVTYSVFLFLIGVFIIVTSMTIYTIAQITSVAQTF